MENRQNLIKNALESIARREGILNVRIEIVEGCGKGNGYAGEKNIAILHGDNKTIDIFIKAVPLDEALKKVFNPSLIFLREILLYTEVMPTFFKFQKDNNVPKPFSSIIECMDTRTDVNNEMLFLRNAKKLGYEVWDRTKQMDKEHVELVFTEYGKYHGLSYALKDQKPEEYNGLVKKFSFNVFEMVRNVMINGGQFMAKKAILMFDPIKDADVYGPYKKFAEGYAELMESVVHLRNDYCVILHGDCWCTNMMFKYGTDNIESRKLNGMLLLDFQIIREGLPVHDLSYFLYCSASKDVYNNLDHYLHIYHNSLSETVRALGSDPDVVFPFKELKQQWKQYSRFGLMMAVVGLKACVQEDNETMELSDAIKESETGDMMEGFMRDCRNEGVYQERLKDLVAHMVKNEFI